MWTAGTYSTSRPPLLLIVLVLLSLELLLCLSPVCLSPANGQDCNGNGELDAIDLLSGTSLDCNTNGIPDECDAQLPATTFRHFEVLHSSDGSWPFPVPVGGFDPLPLVLHSDVDGNGSLDLLRGESTSEGSRGRAALVRIAPGRSVIDAVEFGAGIAPFDESGPHALPPIARFGYSLASLGDLDGDGTGEIAVGAPGMGAVWICSLTATGVITNATSFGVEEVADSSVLSSFQRFGTSVTAIGDLDADGVPDVAVGAPANSFNGPPGGAVWILFLNANGTVRDWSILDNSTVPFTIAQGELFGETLSTLGDLNGDGRLELVIGSPRWGNPGSYGALRVFFLDATGATVDSTHFPTPGGSNRGALHSGAGDFNSDDVPDLVVNRFGSSFQVWSMNPDGSRESISQLHQTNNPSPFQAYYVPYEAPLVYPDTDGDGLDEWLLHSYDAILWVHLNTSDCDGNGVPDSCEIASSASLDANSDGVPDHCASPPPNQLALDSLTTPTQLTWSLPAGATKTRVLKRQSQIQQIPVSLSEVAAPVNQLELDPCPGSMRLYLHSEMEGVHGPISSASADLFVPSSTGTVRVLAPVETIAEALPVPASGGAEFERTFFFELGPDFSCPTFPSQGYNIAFTHDPTVLEVIAVERPDVYAPWWDFIELRPGIWLYGMLACCDSGEFLFQDGLPAACVTYRVLPAPAEAGTEPFTTPIGAGILSGSTPIGILYINTPTPQELEQVPGALALRYTFPGFLRGDANLSTAVDISDAVAVLHGLFSAGPLPCLAAADANDDDAVDIGDAIKILTFLFDGGTAPPAPFPGCGEDATLGALSTCEPLCP